MANTKIIAHRGFWNTGNCAENSLQSLRNAQQLKVYGSEFDVRLTKDGVAVIHHDPEINGLIISDQDFSVISKQLLFNGERISTLREYLKQGKKEPSVKLMMEVKDLGNQEPERQLIDACVSEILKSGVQEQIVFISFSLFICQTLKVLCPENEVQYLNGDLSPQALKNLNIDGFDYEDKVLKENLNWITEAQGIGLSTNCWTVDDPHFFKVLQAEGIDCVTTNIPDVLLKS